MVKGKSSMPIKIIKEKMKISELHDLAQERFGDLVKAVVDIENCIMAIGAELHSDEEAILLENGSQQKHLWGINLYPDKTDDDFVEFDSMINLRPSLGNRSLSVNDPIIRKKIIEIVHKLIEN